LSSPGGDLGVSHPRCGAAKAKSGRFRGCNPLAGI